MIVRRAPAVVVSLCPAVSHSVSLYVATCAVKLDSRCDRLRPVYHGGGAVGGWGWGWNMDGVAIGWGGAVSLTVVVVGTTRIPWYNLYKSGTRLTSWYNPYNLHRLVQPSLHQCWYNPHNSIVQPWYNPYNPGTTHE